MQDPTLIARHLLESAASLAHASNAGAIIAYIDALPDLAVVPQRMVLIARDDADRGRIEAMSEPPLAALDVPDVTLDRFGQVKLAAIIALSNRVLQIGDVAIFLTGPFRSIIDSLVVMTIGAEYELFDTTEQPEIDEHIKRAVFARALEIALHLGQHGREGRPVGGLIVIGDAAVVLEQSEQMILNPFKGYTEQERNLLDERMTETIREYAALDGAIIVRGNGVVESAGARLKTGVSAGLPSGLGARHAAAAGVTANARCVAITVSATDGAVRVWRAGRMLASFDPPDRG